MLELRSIHKSYDGEALLETVSFSVKGQETLCLLGPSGSGKSTILNIIAGLETPDSGSVMWDRREITDHPAHTRDFSLVFQDYALFPHLDVRQNVAFGPRMRGWSGPEIHRRVEEVLDLVNLSGFEQRSVANLSGGEQQRVALARALAPRPRLLMLDEPLAALDRALRAELLDELRQVLRRARIPSIYVTHDQDEAFKIGDRIALLHSGRIMREGSPTEISAKPGSAWAAEFLGLGTVLQGVVLPRRRLQTHAGTFGLPCRHRHAVGAEVPVLIRPQVRQRGAQLGGKVADVAFTRDGYRVTLDNGVFFEAPRAVGLGTRMRVRLPVDCLA